MPFQPPEVRISRHVERLLTYTTKEKMDDVLHRSGLVRTAGSVRSLAGPLTDDSCFKYKRAVKDVLGESAYAFAKVNFVLSGCRCPDCS